MRGPPQTIRFQTILIPLGAVLCAMLAVCVWERPGARELVPWIPWLAMMLAFGGFFFCLFWWAYHKCGVSATTIWECGVPAMIICGLYMGIGIGFAYVLLSRGIVDVLMDLPVGTISGFCLIYSALLGWKLFDRDLSARSKRRATS